MTDSIHTPRTLVDRCNRGERSAWEEFYRTYVGLVSSAVRKLGSADPRETEDVVQEVFLHLFKALEKYDPTRPIEAYILEIARRARISGLRKKTAAKRGGPDRTDLPLDAHDGGEAGYIMIPSPEGDQESSLISAQESGLLRRALTTLSQGCRKLLALRYDKEYSYKEIADTLGVREGTLRVRVQRCLSSLARSYGAMMSEEGATHD